LFSRLKDHPKLLAINGDCRLNAFLAMAAVEHDTYQGRGPAEFYFTERVKSLQLLQETLSKGAVDESLFVAVMTHI
jgi:hypothetical protein